MLPLALLAASVVAASQNGDLASGDPLKLHGLTSATEAPVRLAAEYQLALSLQQSRLPFSAFVWFTGILRAGESHPHYFQAVERLTELQAELDDRFLLPHLLSKNQKASWDRLPSAVLMRINYLRADLSFRKGTLDDAVALLETIPATHPLYFKAQYLAAIALIDRRNDGKGEAAALQALKRIVDSKDDKQEHGTNVRGLATLALARLAYGDQRYAESVGWYTKAKAFPKQRSEAIFEGSFARFQNDDLPGALEDARASASPEAVVHEGTMQYFAQRYPEARKALARLSVATKDLPTNERYLSVVRLVEQVEAEKQRLGTNRAWAGTPFATEQATYLEQNLLTLIQLRDRLASNRAKEATADAVGFGNMAEILRFEIALAEGSVDPAIDSLKLLIAKLEDGSPPRAELLFHLADLYRQKAIQLESQPVQAKTQLVEAQRLLDVVLKEYPAYARKDEVRALRENLGLRELAPPSK